MGDRKTISANSIFKNSNEWTDVRTFSLLKPVGHTPWLLVKLSVYGGSNVDEIACKDISLYAGHIVNLSFHNLDLKYVYISTVQKNQRSFRVRIAIQIKDVTKHHIFCKIIGDLITCKRIFNTKVLFSSKITFDSDFRCNKDDIKLDAYDDLRDKTIRATMIQGSFLFESEIGDADIEWIRQHVMSKNKNSKKGEDHVNHILSKRNICDKPTNIEEKLHNNFKDMSNNKSDNKKTSQVVKIDEIELVSSKLPKRDTSSRNSETLGLNQKQCGIEHVMDIKNSMMDSIHPGGNEYDDSDNEFIHIRDMLCEAENNARRQLIDAVSKYGEAKSREIDMLTDMQVNLMLRSMRIMEANAFELFEYVSKGLELSSHN